MDKNVGAKGGPSKRIKISGPEDGSEELNASVQSVKSKPAKTIKITSFDDDTQAADGPEKSAVKSDKKAGKTIKITGPDDTEENTDDLSMDEVNDESPGGEAVETAENTTPEPEESSEDEEDKSNVFLEEPEAAASPQAAKVAVRSAAAVEPDDHVEVPASKPASPSPDVRPPATASVASVRNSSPVPMDPPVDAEEQDVFEAASHESETDAEPDYSQYTALRKPKKNWKKPLLWTLVALFAIGGVSAGGYVLYKQQKDSKNTTQSQTAKKTSTTSSGSSNTSQPSSNSSAPGTKDYSSTNLQVSFSYPEKWTVDDTSGSKLTVTSPVQKLTDASGQPQDVKIIMRIEKQAAADMSDFKTGDAAAVLQSENIQYTNPTGTQRATTYISFVQYPATTTKGALDGIYVTGNLGYTYAQAIKEADIAKIDPLVRVVFVKCADSNCTSSTATSISSDEWKDKTFSQPITDMFKSLSFQ